MVQFAKKFKLLVDRFSVKKIGGENDPSKEK